MVWGGLFGAGTNTLAYYVTTLFLGFTMLQSVATNQIPWLVLSFSTSLFFIARGIVRTGTALMAGMLCGGYWGTHFAVKKGNAWIKGVFMVMVFASAVKFLFF